jgi:hypothetical protein
MTLNDPLGTRIAALDDLSAIAAAERLADLLARNGDRPAPGSAMEPFAALIERAHADPNAPLEAADPGAIARGLLAAFSADSDLAPLVEVALEASDDQLASKPILAVGVAASLVIFAASTEIKVKFEHIEIHKTVASPELVERVGGVLRPLSLPRDDRKPLPGE